MSLNSQIVEEIEAFKKFMNTAESIADAEFEAEFHGRLWNIEKLVHVGLLLCAMLMEEHGIALRALLRLYSTLYLYEIVATLIFVG